MAGEASASHDPDLDMAIALSLAMDDRERVPRPGEPQAFDTDPGSAPPGALTEPVNLADPNLELVDPTPDLQGLFREYDRIFFGNALRAVECRWSPRMTRCAGLCVYNPKERYCSIRISGPLLRLRPRSDLVETLLHEMIHAYLFVAERNTDHDDHGPCFQAHMRRINAQANLAISIYHSFVGEVKHYQQHWWKCDGPCAMRPPHYGIVRRAMNRAPGPTDRWWALHQRTCGGVYHKIKSPPPKQGAAKTRKRQRPGGDIRDAFSRADKKAAVSAEAAGAAGPEAAPGAAPARPGADPVAASSGLATRVVAGGAGSSRLADFEGGAPDAPGRQRGHVLGGAARLTPGEAALARLRRHGSAGSGSLRPARAASVSCQREDSPIDLT